MFCLFKHKNKFLVTLIILAANFIYWIILKVNEKICACQSHYIIYQIQICLNYQKKITAFVLAMQAH